MGTESRDYMRGRPVFSPAWRGTPVTGWLVGVNAALWFTFAGAAGWGGPDGGLYRWIDRTLLLWPEAVLDRGWIWQPFTAFWFHDPHGLGHVGLNMLFLWFLGRPVEELVGGRPYLRLYLLAGLASTLCLLAYAALAGLPGPGLGASGAVYGVAVHLALRRPHLPVVFVVVRMPLWVLVAVFLVGRELVGALVGSGLSGSAVGHLAGAAFGALVWWVERRGGFAREAPANASLARPMDRPAPGPRSPEPVLEEGEEEVAIRVDSLLEKIHEQGIGSLTPSEKDFLAGASRRYGPRPRR